MDAPVDDRLGHRRDGKLGGLMGFVSVGLADRSGDRLRLRTVAGARKPVRFPPPGAESGSLTGGARETTGNGTVLFVTRAMFGDGHSASIAVACQSSTDGVNACSC